MTGVCTTGSGYEALYKKYGIYLNLTLVCVKSWITASNIKRGSFSSDDLGTHSHAGGKAAERREWRRYNGFTNQIPFQGLQGQDGAGPGPITRWN